MKEIIYYKTFDGSLFENELQAINHTEDRLGMELDGLLKLFCLDITRNQGYKAILQLLRRDKELKAQLNLIINILNYNDEE